MKKRNFVEGKFPRLEVAGGEFRSCHAALDRDDGADQENAQDGADDDQGATRTVAATA